MAFWDCVFEYDTVKFVRIRSKVLGILHYSFLLGILLYLCIWVFGFEKKYLKVEAPSGHARITLVDPCTPMNSEDLCQTGGSNRVGVSGACLSHEYFRCNRSSFCTSKTAPVSATSSMAGGQLRCRYWDHNSLSWPPSEAGAITIGTRVALYHQTPQSQGASCPDQSEPDCQWYPPVESTTANAAEDERARSYYLGDVGNFTLRLYHQANAPSVGGVLVSSLMEGWLMRCKDGKQCRSNSPASDYEKFRSLPANGTADVLRVQDLLDAASVVGESDRSGLDLDVQSDACPAKCRGELNSYRYVGVVLSLTAVYDNTGLLVPDSDSWSGIGVGTAKYQLRVNTMESSKFNVQVTQHHGATNTNRTIHHLHGIRFVVEQTGSVGDFDFNTLLVQLTTSVALIAVATVLVDFLLQYVMPDKDKYREIKFQQETVDGEASLFEAVVGAATLGYVDLVEEEEQGSLAEKSDSASGVATASEDTPLIPPSSRFGAPSEGIDLPA